MNVALFALMAVTHPCERAGTQLESTRCAVEAFNVADQTLNAQYRQSLARAAKRDADAQKWAGASDGRQTYGSALRTAERSWIAFRNAHCVVEGYYGRGGTIEPMLVNFCLARLTRDRTEQLRNMWRR